MANNLIFTIIKIIATIAGFAAIIFGSHFLYFAFTFNFSAGVRFFCSGFWLFFVGLFVIIAEVSSFIMFTNPFLQRCVASFLTSAFWIRGIIYLVSPLPSFLIINSESLYTPWGLLAVTGLLYIVVGIIMCSSSSEANARPQNGNNNRPNQTA